MKVYVILVNFNGWRDTIECLESLCTIDYPDYRIVVCDNGSSDNSIQHLSEWAKVRLAEVDDTSDLSRLRGDGYEVITKNISEFSALSTKNPFLVIIDCFSNLGFGGGNNVGLRYVLARGDCSYVWLLNNDTVVDCDALKSLVARMKDEPSAGMCGSTLLYYGNRKRVQALGGGYYCKWIGLPWHIGRLKSVGRSFRSRSSERWMNYIVGASLLVSVDFIQAVGLMEEEYFLYFEELDWALRGKGKYTLAYAPESIVYHKVGASIGTSSNPATKSYTSDFYNVKNRILFTRKYFPYALPSIYLTLLFALILRVLCGKWERVIMIGRLIAGREPAVQPDGFRS